MFLKPAQASILKNKLFILLILILSFFFISNFNASKIYATLVCSLGNVNAECNNGPTNQDSGGCGEACGASTEPWSKYKCSSKCGGLGGNYCFIKIGVVCSTGDKCVSGDKGLRPGYCDCGSSGPLYKSCCRGSTAVECINYGVQDPYSPPEGTCPSGSTIG